VEAEADVFARKGLQLLVDGSEPEAIRSILEVEIDVKEHFDTQAAKVFEGMGGYSSKLGPGIAVAFVATIYGVGLANLLFLPMANKLKAVIHSQAQFREMVIEGVVSIAEGENPRNIETKLQGYLH